MHKDFSIPTSKISKTVGGQIVDWLYEKTPASVTNATANVWKYATFIPRIAGRGMKFVWRYVSRGLRFIGRGLKWIFAGVKYIRTRILWRFIGQPLWTYSKLAVFKVSQAMFNFGYRRVWLPNRFYSQSAGKYVQQSAVKFAGWLYKERQQLKFKAFTAVILTIWSAIPSLTFVIAESGLSRGVY